MDGANGWYYWINIWRCATINGRGFNGNKLKPPTNDGLTSNLEEKDITMTKRGEWFFEEVGGFYKRQKKLLIKRLFATYSPSWNECFLPIQLCIYVYVLLD
jgi:hypothetical protein